MSHTEAHDEFAELCAVSTSGQLTEEEQKKLQAHLLICPSCQESIKQYEAVVRDAMPSFVASELPLDLPPGPAWSEDQAEDALFKRIRQEEGGPGARTTRLGAKDSSSPQGVLPFGGDATWNQVWGLCAAGILLAIALGICVYQVGMRQGTESARLSLPIPNHPDQVPHEVEANDAAHKDTIRAEIEQRERALVDLHKQLNQQLAAMSKLRLEQSQLASALRTPAAESQNLIQRAADATQKFEKAEANAQALQQKLDTSIRELSEKQTEAAQLGLQVQELKRGLEERQASVEQKDDLLAKDRDIRELMGARDLYVAEVYDVARTGETRKAYGRVFYTRGKSLIFYAYDLDEDAALKNVNTFQAWGRRGPDRQQALNLGIFFEDNASKKRWILKLDDPKMLAQIDAVFVTVEPRGGSHKPSGKPLLFAYLKADPNHP